MFSAFDLAFFGNLIICAILVTASCTLAISIVARRRPHLLPAARHGVYGTCALIALAFFLLAYAFQIHDFHIRYVAHYSDRSMSWPYLLAATWGGQDGSLLAWTFALGLCMAACARWLKGRLHRLQPLIFAVLATVVIFFSILMLFAANPFTTSIQGTPADGNGLNPLLRSFWMLIHPPVLYVGMVAWAVPFAFALAALVTGELSNRWIEAVRGFVLLAWITLAAGNLLGMIWSYEELGWGGYWAWDPVENASFLPMLSGTAYLHSALQQQRRGMFKIWNPLLLCLTFFLTIFGTFLTRSGMIASVHAFARSTMGIYFVVYMGLIAAVCLGLILWRLPRLRSENKIEALISRDFAFVLLNWLMMGMLGFVIVATIFPLLSEAVKGETVNVGAGFYNRWMVPLGLLLLLLLGVGPVLSWRKTAPSRLGRTIMLPALTALAVLILHATLGTGMGYPPHLQTAVTEKNAFLTALAAPFTFSPLIASTLCAFAVTAHLGEFWRGTRQRMRGTGDNAVTAFFSLFVLANRRHGAYVMHLGLVCMCFGFTGAAFDTERQAALSAGQAVQIKNYRVRFDRARMESDLGKQMLLADMTVLRRGETVGRVTPGRYFYAKPPGANTTEVSIHSTVTEDVYVILNRVDPGSGSGTFRVIVRPLVVWIWFGGVLMMVGGIISLLPTGRRKQ